MNRQTLLDLAKKTADGEIVRAIQSCLDNGVCVLVEAKRAGDTVLLEYQERYGEKSVHRAFGWIFLRLPGERQQEKLSLEEAVQKTAEILRADASPLTPKWGRELGLIRFMNTVWPGLPDKEKIDMREAARDIWNRQNSA